MKTKPHTNILHLTDIHGTYHLINEIRKIISEADLVVISGDITHFGGEKQARKIIDKIRHINQNIFAVSGNCDYPEVEEFLQAEGISLHRKFVKYSGFIMTGLSGSLPCPGSTPFEFSENEFSEWLEKMSLNNDPETLLLFISHQPPYNTVNDDLGNGVHVGSRSVRKFIEDIHPVICLTGHIHEGIGISSIHNCKIVNPGPFRNGNYAQISISDNKENAVSVNLKRLSQKE
jgi:uncharacterized protein